jgi:signal transduction histidine kinase
MDMALRRIRTGGFLAEEEAALLVHDMNNGLTVASANLEVLADESPVLSDHAQGALADSRAALERMRVMLGQFLDIHRLEEGRTVRRTPTSLVQLLRDCGRYYTHRGGTYRVEVTAPEASALLDPDLVERAIANLLFNAVRYVGRGGVIRLSGIVHEDAVVIDVGNTGEPPPADKQREIFDKFRTGPTGQRGLGLYFCRLVCRAHDGDIELTSASEFPTVFRMTLAISPDQ